MILSLDKIEKSFRQGEKTIPVLRGVTLDLDKGEMVSILGQSGSGKSTLLSLLCGMDRPDQGEITLNGNDVSKFSEDEWTLLRSKTIGIVFQQFHLIPHLSALENVMLPLEVQGHSASQAKEEASKWMSRVGLEHRMDHFPSMLSGGEKQRVAVARAMIISPEIILADEPSGSLDEDTGDTIMSLIFDLVNQEKKSLILVTHNIDLAKKCHRCLQLHDGVLKEQ